MGKVFLCLIRLLYYLPIERMSKTMAEWKEDLERAFNIMNEELLKAEYKARVGYYWKYMDEIMEEVATHTEAYKKLQEDYKKLESAIWDLVRENRKLKVELELKNLALKQAQEWSILI